MPRDPQITPSADDGDIGVSAAFYEAAIKLLKTVVSYERACTELRRADNAYTQPRMQRAGNRHFIAQARMFSAAKDLNSVG